MKKERKEQQKRLLILWAEDYYRKKDPESSKKYLPSEQKEAQMYIAGAIQEIQNIDTIEKLVKIDDNNPEKLKVEKPN